MAELLLTRLELEQLTGTKQAKRMCAWLQVRGWVHEAPARRGDVPKVLRAYCDARLSGLKPAEKRIGPRLDWMLQPAPSP
jgi:hypothetical protein